MPVYSAAHCIALIDSSSLDKVKDMDGAMCVKEAIVFQEFLVHLLSVFLCKCGC